jgi:hypothetical protein
MLVDNGRSDTPLIHLGYRRSALGNRLTYWVVTSHYSRQTRVGARQ